MTFKHVKFDDSPVMRELARQAIKKDSLKPTVEEMVKQASAVVSPYQASGDVFSDIIELAKGLRHRGYLKQANELENKLFICKQAEAHLYRAIDEDGEDIINAAHPDGEQRVSDAQDGNGIVETVLTNHKKILDVVNKKPTGKQATAIDNLIVATSYVLNIDLKKTAQMAESIEGVEKSTSVQDKVEKVNGFLAQHWPVIKSEIENLSSSLNVVGEDGQTVWAFKPEQLLFWGQQFRSLSENYGRRSGTGNALGQYLALHSKVYGDLNPANNNADAIVRIILSHPGDDAGYQSLKAYGNQIDPTITATYFTGSTGWAKHINLDSGDPEMNTERETSVWRMGGTGWSIDKGTAAQAAQAIYQKMLQRYNAVLGPEPIATANKSLQGDVQKVKEAILASEKSLGDEPPTYDENSKSTYDSIDRLFASKAQLNKLSDKGPVGKFLLSLIQSMEIPNNLINPTAFYSKIASIVVLIDKTVAGLNGVSLSPLDVVYDPDKASVALKNYTDALDIIHTKKDNANENTPAFQLLLKDEGTTKALISIISSGAGNKYFKTYESLKKTFNWPVRSADEIITASIQWLASLGGKQASSNLKMVKTAGPPMPASSGGGNKVPAPTGQPTPAGTGNTGVTGEEKQAVKLMQDALNSLSISLESLNKFDRAELMKLRNSGQGPNTVSGDGVWGPRTKTAIETANKLLNLQMVTTRNATSAAKDAQSNYNILQQVLKGMGKGLDNSVIDSLPNRIDWRSMPETATFDGSQVKLLANDLVNLFNMYQFLVKNGLVKPTSSGASEMDIGQEGITLGEWATILAWFRRRAVFKYNSLKDQEGLEEAKNTAKMYYQKVLDLYNQYSALGSSLSPAMKGFTAEQINSYIVPGTYLQQIGADRGGNGRNENGAGSGYKQNRNGRGGAPGGLGEGHNTRVTPQDNGPPISDNLNLASDWFAGLPHDNLSTTVLNLNQFIRTNAVDMAQTLFGMAPPSMQDAAAAVMQGGYVVRPGQDGNQYVQDGRTGQWFPLDGVINNQDFLKANPQIVKNLETVRDRSPVDKFRQFLGQLSQNIHDISNQWSNTSGAVQEDIVAADEAGRRWQQAIRRKLQQLQDWVKSK